jgi:hypothetical protein
MNADSVLNHDWSRIVSRLGGAAALASTARICKAFLRPRGIRNAVDLLRITLAYCLGERGLRATAAWAAASGLADNSNPAILYRRRHYGDWLTVLIGQLLRCEHSHRRARATDPTDRRLDGGETRPGGQEDQQTLARPRSFRPASRALRTLRADR